MARLARSTIITGSFILSSLGFAGCALDEPANESAGADVGTAGLELTTIPASGVACVAVTVTVGGQTVKKYFSVTASTSSASLSLGQLPLGTASVTASAFSLACSSTTVTGGTAQANWVADTVNATLQSGVVTILELNFRPVNAITASANFIGNVQRIKADAQSTYIFMTDGSLKVVGATDLAYNSTSTPQVVSTLTNVVDIASIDNLGCAVKSDGTVWCWGQNDFGQLGNGTTANSSVPVQVTGLTGMTDVVVGLKYACASSSTSFKTNCWGLNESFRLGADTPTTFSTTPVATATVKVQKLVTTGDATCFLSDQGSVNCWGSNYYGQLGQGDTVARAYRVSVALGSGIVDIVARGPAICALRVNGTVSCWGYNGNGQLGSGTTNNSPSPVSVTGLTDATSIAMTGVTTCASTKSGKVYCWGSNDYGQLGNGTGVTSLTPTLVPGLTGATKLTAGSAHICAETESKVPYCWGYNRYGQLGTGDAIVKPIPTAMKLQ